MNAKEAWHGQTALMWAAAEGHPAVVRALIEAGADIQARSNGGFTALLFAARSGQLGAAKTLLDGGRGAQRLVAGQNQTANELDGRCKRAWPTRKSVSTRSCWPPRTRTTSSPRGCWTAAPIANAAPQGWTALHQVSWVRKAGVSGSNNPAPEGSGAMDSLEFVRKLVAKGAALNARVTKRPGMGVTTLNSIGATPLLLAARTADAELMRLLASLGADPRALERRRDDAADGGSGNRHAVARRRSRHRARGARSGRRWRWSSATT